MNNSFKKIIFIFLVVFILHLFSVCATIIPPGQTYEGYLLGVGDGSLEGVGDKPFTLIADKTEYAINPDFSYTSDGRWHHVVGVYDLTTGSTKIYVDGGYIGTSSAPMSGINMSYADFLIGSFLHLNGSGTNYVGNFIGTIDEVAVWNRELDINEISALYSINAEVCDGVDNDCDGSTDEGVCICGDDIVDIFVGETCDNGTLNNDTPCIAPYNGSCSYCNTSCQNNTVTGPYCGDGNVDTGYGEECEFDSNCTSVPDTCYNASHMATTDTSCSSCLCLNLTTTTYCGFNQQCVVDKCESIFDECETNADCNSTSYCYKPYAYLNGTCIDTLPDNTTNESIEDDSVLCMLSRPDIGPGDVCDTEGESPCWDIVLGKCCGNDETETWDTIYSSYEDLEYVLVKGYCLNGVWRSRDNVSLTYYDMWVEQS